MSFRVLLAFVLGMAVGNLPDHGIAWDAFKLACSLLALATIVIVARREARS